MLRPQRYIRLTLATLAVICFALNVLSAPADAANADQVKALAGIKSIDVYATDVRKNDCSLTIDDVLTSMKFIIAQSKIKFDRSSDAYLSAVVTVDDDCSAASVNFQVKMTGTIGTAGLATTVSVYESAALVTGSATLRRRVLDDIESYTKRFIIDWSSVNP